MIEKRSLVCGGVRITCACLLICFCLLSSAGFTADAANFAKKILVIDSQLGDPYQSVRESMLLELERLGDTQASGFSYEYYSLSHYPGAAMSL